MLREFLSTHPTVWLWENGERIAALSGEQSGYAVESEAGRLVCHFWSPEANLVRRVVKWRRTSAELQLECRRMGRSQATRLTLAPEPLRAQAGLEAARAEYRQALLAALRREWPQWSVAKLDAGPARPVWRLLLRRQAALIVVAATAEPEAAHDALPQALLAAATAQQRHPDGYVAALRLLLPPGTESLTAERCRWLRPAAPNAAVPIEAWQFDRSAGQLNHLTWESDGNTRPALARAVDGSASLPAEAAALLAEMREFCPQVVAQPDGQGGFRFRLYGLEIARSAELSQSLVAPFVFGCGPEQTPLTPAARPLFRSFLRELARTRVADGDARSPYFRLQPERWMEQLLGHDLTALDAHCDSRFIYSQVPVCDAATRDVLDLLTIDRAGRLIVIELKADEDVSFPLQALDYWARVRRHQLAGDFERLGYFPGRAISPLPPQLWLVAPALRWHPQTGAITRWLAPEIPWSRIELNETWRAGIQVVCRQ